MKTDTAMSYHPIDIERDKYPYCIVWTPIPLLTWLFPIIGHMGIATSSGVIRDFAGPYFVSEDNMAFGSPTKYFQLNPALARAQSWDTAVAGASEIYKTRMHNLCCDNCHSHVATALNLMQYGGSNRWNMFKLALLISWHGKYVSLGRYLKTWLPFYIVLTFLIIFSIFYFK
ncbi:unnamed protein product [Ceutorhynchus assimilis]|uniref:Transmembrane protein 222 n=1 Tax=Ceutorhynchus assimilis TaxID=467358 RepID=A0A9N9MS74_9CUCU|nr:unnamed protein product [Ceutorhynchus assimilis]